MKKLLKKILKYICAAAVAPTLAFSKPAFAQETPVDYSLFNSTPSIESRIDESNSGLEEITNMPTQPESKTPDYDFNIVLDTKMKSQYLTRGFELSKAWVNQTTLDIWHHTSLHWFLSIHGHGTYRPPRNRLRYLRNHSRQYNKHHRGTEHCRQTSNGLCH